MPDALKTYRTQRTVTFTENSGRRGVYSIDIRALHRDSYVHLYATSFHPEPIRVFDAEGSDSDFNHDLHPRTKLFSDDSRDKFYQHAFTHVDSEIEKSHGKAYPEVDPHDSFEVHNKTSGLAQSRSFQINSNPVREDRYKTPSGANKPRIWVRRLRANRLHVKWDASPINPHLMNYCIVLNTRRDYSSLCSASGERFGVLPPDLMHVTSYGSTLDGSLIMVEDDRSKNMGLYGRRGSIAAERDLNLAMKHKIRHHRWASNLNKRSKSGYDDIVMGCVGKKTKYVLNNLQPGKLYYFNVFLRDLSTNVSYPYVRTTLKYQSPKNAPNNLRDAKPSKFRLTDSTGKSIQEKVLKFNLNKPCSELTIYVMPCGGGSVRYEALHGNRSVYSSGIVDSLDIIKIGMPQRGKYFVKILQTSDDPLGQNHARMVEVFVGKKNKRFPLPKLPAITKLTEDESLRSCDAVGIQWWPSPDPRDNEYCIFLKEDNRKRGFQFKKPNQCDVERSLKSDPYVTHSLCLQRTLTPETMLLTQRIVGLQPGKTYVVQLILRRHNGKSLSYDLHHIKTTNTCSEIEA